MKHSWQELTKKEKKNNRSDASVAQHTYAVDMVPSPDLPNATALQYIHINSKWNNL